MLYILDNQNSIVNKYLAEVRDVNVQKDSMRFRRNSARYLFTIEFWLSKM